MSRAFQACVRAYELICKPELRANESDDSRDEEEVSDEDEENTELNVKNKGAGNTKKPRKPRYCLPIRFHLSAAATSWRQNPFLSTCVLPCMILSRDPC